MFRYFTLLNFCLSIVLGASQYYLEQRTELLQSSRDVAIGAQLVLNEIENKLNDILMKYKLIELDRVVEDPQGFLPLQHFFKSKDKVKESEVYKIIRKLAKGSVLHAHHSSLVSQEFLYNLTYKDNLYAKLENDSIDLSFFNEDTIPNEQNWHLVSWHRNHTKDFDSVLRSSLTLITANPDATYPDQNSVWEKFGVNFDMVHPLITYRPVFEEYFYGALQELYDDNVMYLEFRCHLPEVFELNGKHYDSVEVAGLYYDVAVQFQKDHPDFLGVRMIYSRNRKVNSTVFEEYMATFSKVKKAYPDFVAGFDLDGREDIGYSLANYSTQLIQMKNETKFFFHAGETNFIGTSTDLNLFDAILLNTTRIGHGYAILKHPKVLQMVKEKDIPLEICPISNQVLKLVSQYSNHPGAVLIANGFPLVISNDDPTFWGAIGVSFDWYMAFMGMASRMDDLRLLKQLAINSIKYSAMDDVEKTIAMEEWMEKWDIAVESLVNEYSEKN